MAKLEWTDVHVADANENAFSASPPVIRMGLALSYEVADVDAADSVHITVALPYDLTLSIEDLRALALSKAKAVLAQVATDLPEPTN